MHTEDGVARLQMENQLAVPGDGRRYLTEAKLDDTHQSGAIDA